MTNRTKEKNIERIVNYKMPAIEINLMDFYNRNRERCKTDIDFINQNALHLIHELYRKVWLAQPNFSKLQD